MYYIYVKQLTLKQKLKTITQTHLFIAVRTSACQFFPVRHFEFSRTTADKQLRFQFSYRVLIKPRDCQKNHSLESSSDQQSVAKMSSTLDQLKNFTTVVADTGDIQGIDQTFHLVETISGVYSDQVFFL